MAKTDIRTNPKFRKLCRRLSLPDSYALGHLECLWLTGYTVAANPVHFRDFEEIEAAADWQGKDGEFAQTLVDIRFLDAVEGGFIVHDIADHAPDFVTKRLKRADERRATADNGGQSMPKSANGPIEKNITEGGIEENEIKGNKSKEQFDPFAAQFNQTTRTGADLTWPLYVAALNATKSNVQVTIKGWRSAFTRLNPTQEQLDAITLYLTEYARIANAANGEFVPHLPAPDKFFDNEQWTAELPKLEQASSGFDWSTVELK